MQSVDVSHQMAMPFHPQGNSRVEGMVKVVENLITAFCKIYGKWDMNIPLLTLAYRTTVHKVTSFTPSFVISG